MKDKVLEIKDLHVEFTTEAGQVHAVRGVDLDVTLGETLAIVGESGSGKSVTTKSIMGLLGENGQITKGDIMYEGVNLAKMKDNAIQAYRGGEIAMIFQDPISSLNPTMTIGAQILEALRLHTDLDRKAAKQRVYELIDLVGIDKPERRYKQYPHQFSGGMRQRVVIAIALACNPKILICDEPTTALDVTIQAQILELIDSIQKMTKVSVIFITHDLGVVANVADRVAVMYAGRIVEYGTVNEIFYNPMHPYTWGLLASMPDMDEEDELYAIPGTPANALAPPKGDAFSLRSEYAMDIDFQQQPPFFKVSDTHYVASWLQHEYAPKVKPPLAIQRRNKKFDEGRKKS